MYDVIRYIHAHIEERLLAEDVARRFGYSKWYFCSQFRKYTGQSFVAYVRHTRMQMAAIEILDGVRPTDAALDFGYDTLGGFNKAFLSEFGCLPREFRKRAQCAYRQYLERRFQMVQLSDRCEFLRREAVEINSLAPRIRAQRQVHFVFGVLEAPAGADNGLLTACGVAEVARRAPALIQEDEWLVGYNFAEDDPAIPDTAEGRRILEEGGFTPAQTETYFSRRDEARARYAWVEATGLPEKNRALLEEWAAMGRCTASNHSVLGYERVLRLGFEGLLAEVEAAGNIGDRGFYEALAVLCRAGCTLGARYAAEARRLAGDEGQGERRREELLRIAACCDQVPARPARSFYEALQSLWFAHILNTWEDGINANSLGRLDQILYPYYRKDIDEGRLTREEAFELVCCLWIKLYRDYDVQQSCVGGCDAQGRPAENELSVMMLDATEQLDFIRCLSVRYSRQTDRAFLKRAMEVVGHLQKGVPFFFNDDVMIPALTAKGISLEDARDYTQIGCVETVIPGRSNPHAVTGETNLLKALEYALANGRSMLEPTRFPGVPTGDPAAFKHYEELKKAVFEQIRHILDVTCCAVERHTEADMVNQAKPYKSLLTEDCVSRGLDFNSHGARYDYYQIMLGGIPNLADSLMAVKKLVFEEERLTLTELLYQLENDFPDEAVRLDLVNKAPKFGNDIDEVDDIACEITDFACDVLEELSEKYGLMFHAQPFTFLWMIDHGRETAATPDGRHKGEIIAYSVSPMQGRDFNGFTALLNSIAKLPTKRAPGTTSAIVEVDPKLFTDANIDRFVDILLAASERGLCNVQFNVVSAQTLLDAQKHPEKYNNLAVRVSGFSQKFNLLDRRMQDHIIGRTKHTCL